VIITLYNQKIYILKIYYCILNQSLKEIEIIFIDDASTDNSILIIERLMEKDKRIKYLKNKINKGQFHSRNKGAIFSKGEYILIIDPDDLLLNNILIKSYKFAKKYNLDIVQFYHFIGDFNKYNLFVINKNSGIYFQPETNKIFFEYEIRYLWDKLIRRRIFIMSIFLMKKKYKNERFIIHNDDIVCFGLFKSAYSYGQIEEIGYFYNRGIVNSTTKKNFLPENINGRFHSLFAIMDYYYEQSKYNKYEKNKGGYRFFEYRIIRKYKKKIALLTDGFDYINSVLRKYINSPFFNSKQKKLLRRIDLLILKRKLINQSFTNYKNKTN
jgi:glycosyltransferase involved in cell wall biosynthesis